MKRVIAYIDGFNLYFGLREKGWKRFYWLNLRQVALNLLKPYQTLVAVKYFTSVVTAPPDKNRRQATFLEALGTLPEFSIYYGHFLADKVTCWQCGHTYTTHREKMTDVNIATELLSDAFTDRFDAALLISADSDLVGPIQKVRDLFPEKRMIVVFPPARHSNALKNIAHACLHLDRATLIKSVFPDQVTKPDGFVLHRPSTWLSSPFPAAEKGEPASRLPLILILGVGDGGSPAATAARLLSSVAAKSARTLD